MHSKSFNTTHDQSVTGDLNIVENDKLYLLMKYGIKFRIPPEHKVNTMLKQFNLDYLFTKFQLIIRNQLNTLANGNFMF